MGDGNKGFQVTESTYFGKLNFHSSRLIEEIAEWLTDPAGFPLVMQGEVGSGREYCLQAACYNQQFYNLPWTIVPIDWAQQGCRDPQQLLDWLAKRREVSTKQLDLLAELVDSFNLDKSPIVLTNLAVFILSNLPNAIDLGKKLLAAWSIPGRSLPEQDSLTPLRRLLENILPERNLVLHICNADTLDLGMAGALLAICKALDDEAIAEQRHGRLLPALSCLPATRPVDLLSRRQDQIHLLYVDNNLSEQGLRECLDRNFSPNRFEDDLIAALHFYGRAKREDRLCSAPRVAAAVGELLEKNLLIWDDDCWQLNPYRAEQNVHTVIGIPLFALYRERLAALPAEMQADADRFMALAALCRQWIPQQLLLEYMGLDEDLGELLLDSLDTAFVDTEPALLIDEQYQYPGFPDLAIYRFAVPLLAVSLLPGDTAQEAEKLLAFLDDQLPKNNRAAAALCRQLAEYCSPTVREDWQERLAWYFAPESAGKFADMLLAKMQAGLVSPMALLIRAVEEENRQSVYFLQAIICACDRWYEEQGGVPYNQESALFFELFGNLLGKLGLYEEALEKHETVLEIRRRVLPEDHPHIANSLNSIGGILSGLGRNEEALEKKEAALTILRHTLPREHPYIATCLDNIGRTLNDLGQYEKALEKHKDAQLIFQRILPRDHPDLAINFNNIGSALNRLGRYEEALQKLEITLKIRQRTLPENHPDIAVSLDNIGTTLSELGRYDEALAIKEAALAIFRNVLPENHPDIAINLNNIGCDLGQLGRHEEAFAKLEEALKILQHVMPAEHPQIEKTRTSLRECRENMGK